MAARKSTRPDLSEVLGQFAESRAVLETACTAMEADEYGDHVMTLRTGLDMLNVAYNALDTAIVRMQ